MPLQQVAQKFQTKPCTCKAILLTYELEGRCEKKTSRRERVEIESEVRIVILDPLNRGNTQYSNIKKSKIYSEEKELSLEEEKQLQKKLIQDVCQQIGEIQTGCYQVQQLQQNQSYDEKAPSSIVRGINMSLHVVSSKLRENPLVINKQQLKKVKLEAKEQHSRDETQQDLVNQRFCEIKQFMQGVIQKANQQQSELIEKLRYLTNQTIFQMMLQQKMQKKEVQIQLLKQTIGSSLKQYFNYIQSN
ncbi:hypothetical protein pb186bvf_005315 [Paramecium bursaria]